ncbi:MAG: hypothetical protein JO142_21580 [Burkholderiales bacterium]|nr:hypothetical protein [Burkholderiales bacterium]
MAHRESETLADYLAGIRHLAMETLGYSLADEEEQEAVTELFRVVAIYVNTHEPDTTRRAWFARTLLSVDVALEIENWVEENREQLLEARTGADFLPIVWPPFERYVEDKLLTTTLPRELFQDIASAWMAGHPYHTLFDLSTIFHLGTKPRGQSRIPVGDADILGFCEGTLGYDCPLVVAAVTQFLFADQGDEAAQPILLFHKSLKYGLPDPLSISCYEAGFADRVVAQNMCAAVRECGYTLPFLGPALSEHRDVIARILSGYPSYFESLLPPPEE